MNKLTNILLILLFSFFINCGRGLIDLFDAPQLEKEEAIYVSTTGDDSNAGTKVSPLQTIQAGIDLAESNLYKKVYVTGGEYTFEGIVITITEGISLYGGYSQDFSRRNEKTVIRDLTTVGGEMLNPNKTIYSPPSVSQSTIIDGFTIIGGSGFYSMSIFLDNSSPVIQNCRIIGGNVFERSIAIFNSNSSNAVIKNSTIESGKSQLSYCVYYLSSKGKLENNTIIGEGGITQTVAVMLEESKDVIVSKNSINGGNGINSYGVVLYKNSAAAIYNNCIKGGSEGGSSSGIYLEDSEATILNNTINGGSSSDYSIGIHIFSQNEPKNVTIANNIIFTAAASNRFGILEEEASSYPKILKNNNIFNCPDGLYISHDGSKNNYLRDMEEVNLLDNRSAINNISQDPYFKNQGAGDWHFSDISPGSIKNGGINAIDEGYDIDASDRDGKKRPGTGKPWAIGAYE